MRLFINHATDSDLYTCNAGGTVKVLLAVDTIAMATPGRGVEVST